MLERHGYRCQQNLMSESIFEPYFKKRFVSGHDFSRAVKVKNDAGFRPLWRCFPLYSGSVSVRQLNKAVPFAQVVFLAHRALHYFP